MKYLYYYKKNEQEADCFYEIKSFTPFEHLFEGGTAFRKKTEV